MKNHIINAKNKFFAPVAVIVLAVISPQVLSSEPIPVDLFSVTGFVKDTLADSALALADQTDNNDPSSIVGGVRNIYTDVKTNTYGSPNSASSIDINYDFLLQLNKLSFSNDDGIGGEGGIQWNGLPGLQDLGTAGDIYKLGENLRAKGDSFAYSIITLDQTNSSPFFVELAAFTNDLKYTRVLVDSSALGDYTIPFDDLENAAACGYIRPAVVPAGVDPNVISVTCGSGNTMPVDMTDVGALQVILNKDGLTTTVDMSIGPITIINPPPPELACRVTAGINDELVIDLTEETTIEGLAPDVYYSGENQYRAGGQAGANTALPPFPKAEWQHHQKSGPFGRFSFHGGTASAPEGTEIVEIRCSDPLGCHPAGNEQLPSPAKQIDFDGIGTFQNIGNGGNAPVWLNGNDANVTAEGNGNKAFDGTFHWFEVNMDDLGEPGGHAYDENACPEKGFGEKGDPTDPLNTEVALCDCPDFYRITIHDGINYNDAALVKNPDGTFTDASIAALKAKKVIYEVYGYIDHGNIQIHPLTGYDTQNP